MTALGIDSSDRDLTYSWADTRPAHAGRPAYLTEARERVSAANAHVDDLIEATLRGEPITHDEVNAAIDHAQAMEAAYATEWQRWQLEQAAILAAMERCARLPVGGTGLEPATPSL